MNQERVQQLEKLLALDSQDVFTNFALGLEFWEGDPERALSQFERVLELDAKYVPAYFQLGKLMAEQGKDKQARDWLLRGMDLAEEVGDRHALEEMQDFLDGLED